MTRIEELQLVARCVIADDREAFGRLVEAYQQPLRRFLLHLTLGDNDLTDDLAQETFVKAYLAVRGFKALAGFKTWLFRIAYNEFYSHTRRQREDTLGDDAPDGALGIVEQPTEARLSVEQAMAALSDNERAVVSLFYIQDLPVAKVASITGMPEGTVKSHLHRAKQKMSKLLS